jgi:hypothetical protein
MMSPWGMRGKGIGFADRPWCRSSLPPSKSSALAHLPLTMAMPQTGSRRSVGKSDWRVARDLGVMALLSAGTPQVSHQACSLSAASTCASLRSIAATEKIRARPVDRSHGHVLRSAGHTAESRSFATAINHV